MLDRLDEVIVACSSAPGTGAVGIVRISGADALRLADRLAETPIAGPLSSASGSNRVAGHVRLGDSLTVPAELYVFRTPHSYTRQDMVEIHTIGSPAVVDAVRLRVMGLGALPAEAGEFTARAFLNGAMDLPAAEAVAGTIRAQSDLQLRASRRMMDGVLARRIKEIRDTLAELLALVEADIDFAEEPIEFIAPSVLRDRLHAARDELSTLLQSSGTSERFDAIPRILLLGPPNAGKSTLMNRLTGTSRAICAAVGGTTRDILSAPTRIGPGEAMLLDTAGVDASTDEVIAQARALTLSAAERVDLVCIVVDVSRPEIGDVRKALSALDLPRTVVAANKSDLVNEDQLGQALHEVAQWQWGKPNAVSALTGTGLDALRRSITEALDVQEITTHGEAILVSERQRAAVVEADESLGRATELAASATETIECADLLAFELREALECLAAVTGEITTEDLLGQVFASFCIGK